MILYAHLHGHKVLGTWLLTFYEQGKIHLKQLIVLLQATVLHRFAPGTSRSPVSSLSTSGATCSPCPDGPGACHYVSSPLPGPSGKTTCQFTHVATKYFFAAASVPDSPLLTFPRSPVPQKRIKLSSGSEAKVRLPLMHTHMSRLPQREFQKYFVFLRE